MNLHLLIGAVAALYASVGHGGASGYLAVLALVGHSPKAMAPVALALNLVVAGTAWKTFGSAGHSRWSLVWPFALGSIPAAIVGGWMPVSTRVYGGLLALTLAAAAVRLFVTALQPEGRTTPPRSWVAAAIGAVIGLVSGIVGVGGGIFLSPLMLLCRWAPPRQTAAASAAFIVLNSLAGLIGRFAAGRLNAGPAMPLAAAALAGGLLGAHMGARLLPSPALRLVLAGVLMIASAKLGLAYA